LLSSSTPPEDRAAVDIRNAGNVRKLTTRKRRPWAHGRTIHLGQNRRNLNIRGWSAKHNAALIGGGAFILALATRHPRLPLPADLRTNNRQISD
jgi:hypothetical protein